MSEGSRNVVSKNISAFAGVVIALTLGAAYAHAAPRIEQFRIPASDPRGIALAIEALCEVDTVVFKVVNTGSTWPAVGVFGLFTESGQPIRQWSRRLTAGQTITFTRPADSSPDGFMLRVDPSWDAVDAVGIPAAAKIACP